MIAGVVHHGRGHVAAHPARLTWTSSQTRAHGRHGRAGPRPRHGDAAVHARRAERRRPRLTSASPQRRPQFFRNVGSTVGIAVFGTVMTSGLAAAIASHLPAEGGRHGCRPGPPTPAAVLDPAALAGLPAVVADAVRQGLADSAPRGLPHRHAARARRARRDDRDQGPPAAGDREHRRARRRGGGPRAARRDGPVRARDDPGRRGSRGRGSLRPGIRRHGARRHPRDRRHVAV